MTKCPTCNGCLEHVWYKTLHFWWCFLCKKHYIIQDRKLVSVNPDEEYNRIYPNLVEKGIK